MREHSITVTNRAGIHARPAAMMVQAIKNYVSSIYIEQGRNRINAKSIMGLLTLGAGYGSEIKIIADGADEDQAVDCLVELIASNFDEMDVEMASAKAS